MRAYDHAESPKDCVTPLSPPVIGRMFVRRRLPRAAGIPDCVGPAGRWAPWVMTRVGEGSVVGLRRGSEQSAGSPEHADVVVVGSGFGGSVTAYREAEAGRSVILLERGKPYPPGSFARTPSAMGRNLWDPSEGLQGLFDVWTFRGLEGVVSSGLGGGSLIYANVLLRKDEKWFVHESPVPGGGYEHWPLTRSDLDPHYDRVEQMLGA